MNLLFVAAEAQPLIKTGGLADVCGSLPVALHGQGHEVRLLLPGYPQALERAGPGAEVATLRLPGASGPVRLLERRLPGTSVTVYLVDSPEHFCRPGTPYQDPDGACWPDNARRFALLARAAVEVALGRAGLGWEPHIVHCHDWHTGLVPALLSQEPVRPATVFTIHNLAYQGLFPEQTFRELELPQALWSMDGVEFYGQLSFIKGGLACADWLTTVSPTYAEEICTPELGCGLDGLLRHRQERLIGILNGADYSVWDPSCDPLIPRCYSAEDPSPKGDDKRHLQRALGLVESTATPLVAFMGRLVEQKGVDLLLEALPALMQRPLQLVVMGQGERRFAEALEQAAARHPGQLAVRVGYTEELAHRIEAAADMFLMPSRFEPCGLTQLYALRYGAVPIVRATGGLADTITEVGPRTLRDGTASGFTFNDPTPAALLEAIDRAVAYHARPEVWRRVVRLGMQQEFSWRISAESYQGLYRAARYLPVRRRVAGYQTSRRVLRSQHAPGEERMAQLLG